MFKTVLVPQTGVETDRQSLEAAHGLMCETGGHLECLYVHDDAAAIAACIQTDAMGVPIVTPSLLTALDDEAKTQKLAAKQTFETFCKKQGVLPASSGPHDLSAAWRAVSAGVVTTLTVEGYYHDATVLTRQPDLAALSVTDLGAIVISSGRPFVLIPEGWQPHPLANVAVAWKETPEAARAVAAALPVLKQAKTVTVLTVAEKNDARDARKAARACARYLKSHGIEAEGREVAADGEGAEASLFFAAAEHNADLVVMGAYGHSRLREFVLGGFTREVLLDAQIPVLLMH
ncbi:MAG TPA: universal stress protein [Rhizomicrobium sp.]